MMYSYSTVMVSHYTITYNTPLKCVSKDNMNAKSEGAKLSVVAVEESTTLLMDNTLLFLSSTDTEEADETSYKVEIVLQIKLARTCRSLSDILDFCRHLHVDILNIFCHKNYLLVFIAWEIKLSLLVSCRVAISKSF